MTTAFTNELTDAEVERLAILAEELGEAQQCIGKILRHGYESYNPVIDTGRTNRRELERELGDIVLAINQLQDAKDVNGRGNRSARDGKGRENQTVSASSGEIMTEPRVEAGDRALEAARKIHLEETEALAFDRTGPSVKRIAALIQSAMNAQLSRSHRRKDAAEPKGRTVVSGNRVADEPRPGGKVAEDVFAKMRSFLTNMRRDASETEDPELAEYANAIEQFVTEAESAMNAQERELREALQNLVSQLQKCHADQRYQSVWQLYAIHGGQYTGPFYREQLAEAERLLAERGEGK